MNFGKHMIAVAMILLPGSGLPAADLTLDAIFPADKVLDVQITVPAEDWDTIRYQSRNFFEALNAKRQFGHIPGPYTYVEASVSINGVKFPKVGLRKKGFIGSQSSVRPSLKVKLDFVDPESKIEGLNTLTFNNNKQDTAQVSQFMGYALFNKAGSPAPRCALANVTVNGKNLGIYSHVESYKKPILERGFGDKAGTLYEGTVVDFYEQWEKSFELKRGEDAPGRAKILELIGVLNSDSGSSGVAILDSESEAAGWVPTSGASDEKWMQRDFNDSKWKKGAGGAGVETSGGYEEHIHPGLDFEEEMHEQTSSVYLRYKFSVEDLGKIGGLTLRMKYDDGFIAYLNGAEVASSNAPADPAWDSQATGPNDDGAAVRYQAFPISGHIGKLRKGANVLAVHGLNVNPASSDLLISPELRVTDKSEKKRDLEAEIGKVVDLDAFYKFWAMEGLLGFWDGYSGNRNNFFFYLNPTTEKFHFMPWGADSLFVKYSHINRDRRVPLSVKTGGMIANKLYQLPASRARYKKTLLGILKEHWDEKKLLAETDRIEALLDPYIRESSRQRGFYRSLDSVRQFIRTRREEILDEVADGMPVWTKGSEPPVAIPGGGFFGGRGRGKKEDDKEFERKTGDLYDAARKGDLELVKVHLEKMGGKVAIDRKDNFGAAALHWAAGFGRLEVVEYLVKNGANVNITNREGETPLDNALEPFNEESAEFISGLFRLEIDPAEVNKGKKKVVEFLRKNSGKDGGKPSNLKSADLWAAARAGDVEGVAAHLLKMGGKDAIDRKDGLGAAALSWAAGLGRLEVVEYLVKNGADVNVTNKEGKTPLDDSLQPLKEQAAEFISGIFRVEIDLASVNELKPKIAELLRAKGAKTGAQLRGLKGSDAWAAARAGDVDALKKFVEKGGDIQKKDQFSTTPLHWAVALGRVETVKYLLAQGAEVNAANQEGETPLDETYESWNNLAVDFMQNFFGVETEIEEVNAGRKVIRPLLKAKGARRGKGAK
ncbi:MAG: CotH kinase family protein [Planctomycetota bacterium]|nr:CotH kinase family protein [Planctomycetota bacterium]